jgi:large subunit ribosomal protein L21
MAYAIVKIGGKQYRVQQGQRLLVDRVKEEAGATFTPAVLLLGGDGDTQLSPDGATVTARVVDHVLGEKIRIGKYKPKKGYRRHTGFRSRLTRIEIESIGAGEVPARAKKRAAAPAPEPQPAAEGALPGGYDGMTIAQLKDAAPSWELPQLQAALAYEREHGNRKGAIAALETAIAEKEKD